MLIAFWSYRENVFVGSLEMLMLCQHFTQSIISFDFFSLAWVAFLHFNPFSTCSFSLQCFFRSYFVLTHTDNNKQTLAVCWIIDKSSLKKMSCFLIEKIQNSIIAVCTCITNALTLIKTGRIVSHNKHRNLTKPKLYSQHLYRISFEQRHK